MVTDQQLLREYAEGRSETAFAELVRRHVDLVFSAALRMVRDAHLAEDVTQGVFVALAQAARQLGDRPVLAGWLHRTAQNLAAKTVRSAVRRRAREEEAAAMQELLSAEPDATWDQIARHLDAALGELDDTDRDAVLLRYFEQKSAHEMAQRLGVSDEAAQKRVSRAVERLRKAFASRGVTIGAGGLAVLLAANGVQAAPAGLAATICASAALAGTAITGASATATVAKTIAMTTLQKVLVISTITVLAGAGVFEARQAAHLREQVARTGPGQASLGDQAALVEQLRQSQQSHADATNRLAALEEERRTWTNNTAELLRLRGLAGVARRAIAETAQLRSKLAQQASEAASNNPISGAMADAMKQAVEHQYEGQLGRMTASLRLTPEQVQAARDILRRQAQAMTTGMQQGMTGRFDKTEIARVAREAGDVDTQIKALLSPDQLVAFPVYKQEEAAHTAGQAANQELLQMQTSLDLTNDQLDRVYAALYTATLNQFNGTAPPPPGSVTDTAAAMQWGMDQKVKAMESVLTPVQLDKYRQQQETQAKLVRDIANQMGVSGTTK